MGFYCIWNMSRTHDLINHPDLSTTAHRPMFEKFCDELIMAKDIIVYNSFIYFVKQIRTLTNSQNGIIQRGRLGHKDESCCF